MGLPIATVDVSLDFYSQRWAQRQSIFLSIDSSSVLTLHIFASFSSRRFGVPKLLPPLAFKDFVVQKPSTLPTMILLSKQSQPNQVPVREVTGVVTSILGNQSSFPEPVMVGIESIEMKHRSHLNSLHVASPCQMFAFTRCHPPCCTASAAVRISCSMSFFPICSH